MPLKTINFQDNKLILLDQRRLPLEISFFQAENYQDTAFAIKDMVVRGAPAIGATAAYGVYLAALEFKNKSKDEFFQGIISAGETLKSARPTAVNLKWAVNGMLKILVKNREKTTEEILTILKTSVHEVAREDIEINKKIAENGNELIPDKANILTHCNTGALATVDYGTALGVIRKAFSSGKTIHVYIDETRPRLQGARLTAFELQNMEIPCTLIVDSVAAVLLRDGKIDLVLVGADRIANNGDTANKIGTYMLSEISQRFNVPFYVVAPTSTIDFCLPTGEEIEIEERDPEEITHIEGKQIAPANVKTYNPAFDITPAQNITAIVTEKGIIRPQFKDNIQKIKPSLA